MLIAPLCTTGCWLVQPITPPCPQVRASPVVVSVYFSAPSTTRRSFVLRLHEGGGLYLELIPWEMRCASLTDHQADEFLENTKTLIEGLLAPEKLKPGEAVSVHYGKDFHGRGIVGVADLTPTSVAAVRTLSCIAFDEFGRNATRAFRGATPELTRLIGYPDACRSTLPGGDE